MRKEIVELFKNEGYDTKDLRSQNMFYKIILDSFIENGKDMYKVKEIYNRVGIATNVYENKKLWYYNTISTKNWIYKELFQWNQKYTSDFEQSVIDLLNETCNTKKYRTTTNIKEFFQWFLECDNLRKTDELDKYNMVIVGDIFYVIYKDEEYKNHEFHDTDIGNDNCVMTTNRYSAKDIRYLFLNRNRFTMAKYRELYDWLKPIKLGSKSEVTNKYI